MTIPILGSDDRLIHPQDIAVVFRDVDGGCVWVETTPQERLAIVRKLASNRQWHSKNYATHEVALIDATLAQRIGTVLASIAETNPEANALLADLGGEEPPAVVQ